MNRGTFKRSQKAREDFKWGLIFISPWIVGFLTFYLIPIIASFGFTLFNFNLSNPAETGFIGLGNWKRLLVDDPEVLASIIKVSKFGLITLPISLGVALSLAILLNSRHLFATNIFRTLFYMPTMIPLASTVIIFWGFLNGYTGWLDLFLEKVLGMKAIGIEGLLWLDKSSLIYYSYTMIGLWGLGNTVLILLAGLQNVPTELYEAAVVDGAGWWSRLFRITLPMISPVIFYNLVIAAISLMQYFLVPYMLVGTANFPGYPDGATNFTMVYFYKQAFTFFNMGYGAAIAWVIFLIALSLTVILFATAKYWVYYAGEK